MFYFLITKDFEDYVFRNNGKVFIDEGLSNKVLRDKSRKAVVNLLAAYTNEKFGLIPNHFQKEAVCLVCITLFPCLRTENDDLKNIVSITFY
jgi:hypothetical protein